MLLARARMVASRNTTVVAGSPPAGEPAWRTGMAVGEWKALTGTNLSAVEPSPNPGGSASNKIFAWNSHAIDTRNSKVYGAANGGHTDYAGNEVDALALEVDAPAWVALRAPTAAGSVDEGPYYADGRPSSNHSYYGQIVDETNDRCMRFGGSMWNSGNVTAAVSSFRTSDNDWNSSGTHPDIPSAISVLTAFACARDPTTGNVYLFAGGNIVRWNRSVNNWTTLVDTLNSGINGNEAASAYDSTRGRFLFLGGSGADSHTYTVSGGTVAAANRTGSEAANVLGAANGMVYAQAIDAYLLRKAAAGGTVYRVDAGTFACTLLSTSGGGSIPATSNGPYNKFLYAPNLGGCIYVPDYTGNAWFLRAH